MADRTKIGWTRSTLNPIRARRKSNGATGFHCEHVSEACRFCYAEGMNKRGIFSGLPYTRQARDEVEIYLDDKVLLQPFLWKRPRKIFICSTTDIFGEWVTDAMLDRIFAVMALCPQHTFQVLTKRPKRMREYLTCVRSDFGGTALGSYEHIYNAMGQLGEEGLVERHPYRRILPNGMPWPLRNVWFGVTAEDQDSANARREDFLATPAAVKFVSYEPALGPVDWTGWEFVQQIIFGGESGRGARPPHPDWARDTRDFCSPRGIAFYLKQWGEWAHAPWKLERREDESDTEYKLRSERTAASHTIAAWPDSFQKLSHAPWSCERAAEAPPHHQGLLRAGTKNAGRLLDGVEHSAFPEAA